MNNYTFETLRTKSFEELKAIAVGIGLGISEGEKRQKLLSRIMEVTAQISPERPKEEMAEKARQSVFSNTEDGVLEALQPYLERGLHITFSDGCFHMRAGTKQDSGTLRQPLAVIARCAESLMRR